MTNEEVTQKLTLLKDTYNGYYWNHYPVEKNDASSITNTPCSHSSNHNYDGTCGCNSYNGAIQCYGFSLYLANLVFGVSLPANIETIDHGYVFDNGWTVYKNMDGISLEPGDIFRANSSYGAHSAMVWKVNNGSVEVAECWGGVGCKLNWGLVNGTSVDSNISNIKDNLIFLIKAPKTGVVNPPTPTQTITVTFKKNETSNGGTTVDTRTYTVGGKYDPLPTVSRTGYNFDGWWPERQAVTNYTRTNV